MKLKGLLIKPFGDGTGTIEEVEVRKGELKDYYSLIECSTFAVGADIGKNSLYVDDEGLIKTYTNEEGDEIPPKFFSLQHLTFAGNGLVLGFDIETGESIDTDMTIDQVKNMIEFQDEKFSMNKDYKETMLHIVSWG